jgi:outer membrane biosynthesis protein TonB
MRILESQPRGVFDRTVQQTLGRWRYEPPSAPREITHTFDFEQ